MCAKNQFSFTESQMMLAAGFFDESADGEFEDRVFTIAGYIAGGASSVQLDLRWTNLLKKHSITYFKCSELESGIGEFAKFRDRPETAATDRFTPRERDLLREIKIEFVDLLCAQEIVGISATIHMRHLKAFAHDKPALFQRLPPFYQLCGHLVMMDAGFAINEANAKASTDLQTKLRPIFDSHQEFGPRFIKSFPEFSRKNPECSRNLLPPMFEDEQVYKCLQAADLFAYEVRRTVSNHFFEPHIDLRRAMRRLFPNIRSTFVLDYDTLLSLAEAQPIQSIEEQYSEHLERPS